MKRVDELVTGEIYHVMNKSIAEYRIFNSGREYSRMIDSIKFYRYKINIKFSEYILRRKNEKDGFDIRLQKSSKGKTKYVDMIAYCLMPTHIHIVVKQLVDNGISIFMGNLLNSYARYFNIKHDRVGPLWQSKFKNVWVEDDEQLVHLTRYIHLNPTTSGIVNKPEDWKFSSVHEYISDIDENKRACDYDGIIDMSKKMYKKFLYDRISYQKELAYIKNIVLE